MIVVEVELTGISPMSHSQQFTSPRPDKEKPDDHDKRCWKEKMHVGSTGHVAIPQMGLKQALDRAATNRSEKLEGKKTFGPVFRSGILITDEILTDIVADTVDYEDVYVNSDGRRGSGKRVWRRFPHYPAGWTAKATIYVLNPLITREILERHLIEAGQFVGLGRFRPENGGHYGRFRAVIVSWQKVE